MDSVWALALLVIVPYLFAPPEKKRAAGVQAFPVSLALLGSFYVAGFVMAKLMAAEVSIAVTILLTLLTYGITFLSIASVAWHLLKRFWQQ